MDGNDAPDELGLIALADAVLALAHQLERRGPAARDLEALTNTEITVIREAHREPGVTATRIAAATGLQRSYVSASAHGLEARGLLTRGEPAEGQRGVGFHPTPQADADLLRIQRGWVELLSASAPEVLAGAAAAAAALDATATAIGQARAAGDAASSQPAAE
ncbi:helix-turn-helix domain-containing protein [Microbacterium sp. cx-59]|uniref:MarR family transcriptional regulator n=1 Tax=Microbacterium sp. cx-59 TaxID=2891207 RepID=UPI001E4048E4|nr:helix-turn-helix domain-containing protein [Microbacterium sp. cx-59]MCC4907650.1 MarR family transcriptional regulator [Microbacterium sp. cx-59]